MRRMNWALVCLAVLNINWLAQIIVNRLVLPEQALQARFPDWRKKNERPHKNLAAFQSHGQNRSAKVKIA